MIFIFDDPYFDCKTPRAKTKTMIVDVRNKEEFGVPEYFLSEVDKQVCIVLLSKTVSFDIQRIQAGTHLCDIYWL